MEINQIRHYVKAEVTARAADVLGFQDKILKAMLAATAFHTTNTYSRSTSRRERSTAPNTRANQRDPRRKK